MVRLPAGVDLDRQVLDVEREGPELHDLLKGTLELPAEAHNGSLPLRSFVHREPLLVLLRFQVDQVIQVEPWRKEWLIFEVVSEVVLAGTLVALLFIDDQLTHFPFQAICRQL